MHFDRHPGIAKPLGDDVLAEVAIKK